MAALRRWALRVVLLPLGGVVLFGVVTGVALEGGEVVVLRIAGPDGPRETPTWLAEADGVLWPEDTSRSVTVRLVSAGGP